MSLRSQLSGLFRRRYVMALVGKSGTGKSFRAQLLAQDYDIDLIIDDGLLIHDQSILTGRSAKRESGSITAIKTALFHDPKHAEQARRAIDKGAFGRILILGTSRRMIERIAERLGLPQPARIVEIEEIATEEEIEIARRSRQRDNRHIIPVPEIEVKRTYPHIIIDSIKCKPFKIITRNYYSETTT